MAFRADTPRSRRPALRRQALLLRRWSSLSSSASSRCSWPACSWSTATRTAARRDEPSAPGAVIPTRGLIYDRNGVPLVENGPASPRPWSRPTSPRSARPRSASRCRRSRRAGRRHRGASLTSGAPPTTRSRPPSSKTTCPGEGLHPARAPVAAARRARHRRAPAAVHGGPAAVAHPRLRRPHRRGRVRELSDTAISSTTTSARPASSTPTRRSCAARPACATSRRTPPAASSASSTRCRPSPAATSSYRSTSSCSEGRRRSSQGAMGARETLRPWSSTSAPANCSALVSLPDLRQQHLHRPRRRGRAAVKLHDDPASRWSTTPSPRCTRRAVRSSRSPASRRCRKASPTPARRSRARAHITSRTSTTRASYIFRDWSALGTMDFYRGVAMSSDVYFYYLAGGYSRTAASLPGPRRDALADWTRRFGLGAVTGIDMPGESEGIVPDPTWKENNVGEPWTIGDTYNFGIGQGYVAATPMQMALVTAAVANGGNVLDAARRQGDPQTATGQTRAAARQNVRRNLNIDPRNLDIMREGMRQAVDDGTAHRRRKSRVVQVGRQDGYGRVRAQRGDGSYRSTAGSPATRPSTTRRSPSSSSSSRATAPARPRPSAAKIFDYYFGRRTARARARRLDQLARDPPLRLHPARPGHRADRLRPAADLQRHLAAPSEARLRPHGAGRASGRVRVVGLIACLVVSRLDYRFLAQASTGLYFGLIAALHLRAHARHADLRLAALDRYRRHRRSSLRRSAS